MPSVRRQLLPQRALATLAAIAVSLCLSSLDAGAVDAIAAAIGTTQYERIVVETQADGDGSITATLSTPWNERWTLDLRPYALRADEFTLVVHDSDGYQVVEAPACRVLSGVVTEVPDSIVRATRHDDGSIEAFVQTPSDGYVIQSLSWRKLEAAKTSHVFYTAELRERPPCGVVGVGGAPLPSSPIPAAAPVTGYARIGVSIDVDVSWIEQHFLPTASVDEIVGEVEQLVATASLPFEALIDDPMSFELRSVVLRFEREAPYWDPDPLDPGAFVLPSSACELLERVVDEWSGPLAPLPGLPHALFDSLTPVCTGGCSMPCDGLASSAVGCGGTDPVASATWRAGTFVRAVFILAHELAHLMGASHCTAGAPDCDLMCYDLAGACPSSYPIVIGQETQDALRTYLPCAPGPVRRRCRFSASVSRHLALSAT